jgi:hypothetical protein
MDQKDAEQHQRCVDSLGAAAGRLKPKGDARTAAVQARQKTSAIKAITFRLLLFIICIP